MRRKKLENIASILPYGRLIELIFNITQNNKTENNGEYYLSNEYKVYLWEMNEILYLSLKGNSKCDSTMSEYNFYEIFFECIYLIRKSSDNHDESNISDLFSLLSNEQFLFQKQFNLSNFNRTFYMLFEIDSTCEISFYNLKKVIEEKYKLKFDYAVTLIISITTLIWSYSSKNHKLSVNYIVDSIKKVISDDNNDVEKILRSMIVTKDYYTKKRTLNYYTLLSTPLVYNEDETEFYIINKRSFEIYMENFFYWEIRNYYFNKEDDQFLIQFGTRFELYMENFLNNHNFSYEKIATYNESKPDWKIIIGDYIILLEQKSALYNLNSRVVFDQKNLDNIDKYNTNHIEKAFKQLNSIEIGTKNIIRICLTYETINLELSVRKNIWDKCNYKFPMINNWIMNIDVFEQFLLLSKSDENKFYYFIEQNFNHEQTTFQDLLKNKKSLFSKDNEFNYQKKYIELFKSISKFK